MFFTSAKNFLHLTLGSLRLSSSHPLTASLLLRPGLPSGTPPFRPTIFDSSSQPRASPLSYASIFLVLFGLEHVTNKHGRDMEKAAVALSSANWRRPLLPHDHNTPQLSMRRRRRTNSSTETDSDDVAELATYWRKPVAGVSPFQTATDPIPRDNSNASTKGMGMGMADRVTKCAVVNAVPVPSSQSKHSS